MSDAPASPHPETLRLLVVEDSELDFEVLRLTLARQGVPASCRRVETAAEMSAALRDEHWDAVISDHQLPAFSSERAFDVLSASGFDLPFVIVSGTIGEEFAVAAMRRGADDYLMKGKLDRLGAALANAIDAARARRERAAALAALADSERRLQDLSAHLISRVEDERAAIARELHDEVGGTLTSLRFDLAWIQRHADGEIAARARRAVETVGEAMHANQRMMRELRPPVLDAGLLAALDWQVAQFRRRAAIPARFTANVDQVDVDEARAIVAYRTLQEALTNVLKHAQARSVTVDVVVAEDLLSLEICDDGVGIQPSDRDKPSSFGLRGLAERARQVAGWVEVMSGSPGTSVLLSMPLRGQTDGPAPGDASADADAAGRAE